MENLCNDQYKWDNHKYIFKKKDMSKLHISAKFYIVDTLKTAKSDSQIFLEFVEMFLMHKHIGQFIFIILQNTN